MLGRMNTLLGYTDSEIFNELLKLTESSWLKISASPFSPGELVMSEENKIQGNCFGSSVNITFNGDTATASIANITSVFHVLPSCEGCLVFSINTTVRDFSKFLHVMKLNITAEAEALDARSLYLMGKESTVKDADLEHFKQQASCLGFSREPDFHHNPEKEFCEEGEGVSLKFR
ncbi:uncharacterized protein LOC120786638 isoform X2 [Xiphias gladius]|nr:uncharacterized protein LOC120786638 isoform X2 [Xiphias gladius]